MLKSFDVLIGLTVIMLALSMAVTMITQFVTTVVNSRGRHLKRGLADLLQQLDPAFTQGIADHVAEAVLKHPLVSNTAGRLGTVVHREEFTTLLLHLAEEKSSLTQDVKDVLVKALKDNEIPDPAGTLENIRGALLDLEAASPQLATDVKQATAILQEARSRFVAKVNNWFDQTMTRVSQRFTASTRAITFVGAFVVAVALQVDTIGLVDRLSADDLLRQAFVSTAVQSQVPSTAASQGPQTDTDPAAREKMGRQYLAFLHEKGVISVADSLPDWWNRWGEINVLGVIVTSLLLSLGAPFWYKALGRLIQLRPTIAAIDDAQRAARQQMPPAGARDVAPPGAARRPGGERGDVAAAG